MTYGLGSGKPIGVPLRLPRGFQAPNCYDTTIAQAHPRLSER
ncbi:hypothetical protein QM012_005747 [Aureobasidium pullulans]|uniref:Uncharacterized protein n=1 Tax=Aureobasidium pullulans TaxID=5580 RepID=A0ABR0TQM4_AURPU